VFTSVISNGHGATRDGYGVTRNGHSVSVLVHHVVESECGVSRARQLPVCVRE
jgi:hypothetical protein